MSTVTHWSRYMLEDTSRDPRSEESLHERIQAGVAREMLLKHWIQHDKDIGDPLFTSTRRSWWESMKTRIWSKRPLPLKLPHCLVEALGLQSQAAVLTEENEVWTLIETPAGAPMRGICIVPVEEKSAEADSAQ